MPKMGLQCLVSPSQSEYTKPMAVSVEDVGKEIACVSGMIVGIAMEGRGG